MVGCQKIIMYLDYGKLFSRDGNEREFKGALKPKYGTKCKLLNDKGIQFE